ncbi:hypothetical protein TREMEDRAFT_59211 [Tremella mesenterica DSM 1558]|uniref:uncharacterized protein n=1 Tax=Tremella mesenterica (strain ATCC 24925 / CBS 8224 / DSM 1558 / NBRC 9311 / NRRL Y-6157 / RJB 2259-6 / UBC 559-6) TaxID=578456 RepID=UPI0003F49925|nr:uncharacterized protein TREMEDRAFT_59211 [Tremella mesenterica DSM 1558]EIW73048.1 hypothetical protein TREMEDRAFT_59211 [Tremella mesenterica DSM 1558]
MTYGIQWDEDRQELYIPVIPNNHIDQKTTIEGEGEKEYRLTPWREEDRGDMVRICNHPEIGKWSFRRPFPFLPSDADYFLVLRRPEIQHTLSLLYYILQSIYTKKREKPIRFIFRIKPQ